MENMLAWPRGKTSSGVGEGYTISSITDINISNLTSAFIRDASSFIYG